MASYFCLLWELINGELFGIYELLIEVLSI